MKKQPPNTPLTPLQRLVAAYSLEFARVQLYSYEGANACALALGIAKAMSEHTSNAPSNPVQTAASLAYPPLCFLGSFLIGLMGSKNPKLSKNPSLKLYGGLLLATGGLGLAAAGFPAAGLTLALTSMEIARGGSNEVLENAEKNGENQKKPVTAGLINATYGHAMTWLLGRIPAVGKALADRPDFYPQMVKAVTRSEIIGVSAIRHDWAMMAIGLSWVFGDVSLAMFDKKFRRGVRRKFGLPESGDDVSRLLGREPVKGAAAEPM